MSIHSAIAHLNVAGFRAQVLESTIAAFRGAPFIVTQVDCPSAIVLDVSRCAREKGLAPGMTVSACRKLCPGIRALPPDTRACEAADENMARIALKLAPVVQEDTGGHLYLDLTGTRRLWGTPSECALTIRNEIEMELGLDIILALAPNKLVAKVLSRMIAPSGFIHIKPGTEDIAISEADIGKLPGVGPAITEALSVAGITRIGEIARLRDGEAFALLGSRGRELRTAARGIDKSIVTPGQLAGRRIERHMVFPFPLLETADLRAVLLRAAENMGTDLRKARLACGTVHINIEYSDGVGSEAVKHMRAPVYLDGDILEGAESALAKAKTRRVRLKSLNLALEDLSTAAGQKDLFLPCGQSREERIQAAVDISRRRHGLEAVTRGLTLLGRS